MKNTFAICAFLASIASAHMQMSHPLPIRSPLNPEGKESEMDFSYKKPLSSSGSDYPCKGYAHDTFHSVANYSAGGRYIMSLEGSATHNGGSCQLSLSYDTGKTFRVIKSIEGGCPLSSNYSFTIPSDAPSGDALFAWTWFNKVGNREMYMNCAQVTIDGNRSSMQPHGRDVKANRGVGFSSRPPIFIANIDGPGGCKTTETEDVKFPLPGPDVVGGVNGTGYSCTGSADFLGSGGSSFSNITSTISSPRPSTSAPFSATSSSKIAAKSPTSTSSTGNSTSSSSRSSPSTRSSMSSALSATTTAMTTSAPHSAGTGINQGTETGQACEIDGAILCGAQGNTWSVCNHGRVRSMGMVAPGTTCENGAIVRRK